MYLVWLACAWMLGTAAAEILGWAAGRWWVVVAIGGGVLLFGVRGRQVGLVLICLGLAALRLLAANAPPAANEIGALADQGEVVIIGAIAEDPRRAEGEQRLVLAVEAAQMLGVAQAASGRIVVTLPAYPAYQYGQRLRVRGVISRPNGARRAGDFDYRAYLARRGIFSLMREAEAEVLDDRAGNPALRAILQFRERCRVVLLRALPEPQAALAIGIVLGLQSGLPEEYAAAFSITGTSHILVVSGWNFTIVAAVLSGIATRSGLGRWPAFWLALAVMWLYAIFVGASMAVLRAALMASLMVFARTVERRSEPWILLAVACWAMVAIAPQTLWDIGFQLSALATASLFAFATPIGEWLARLPLLGRPQAAPIHEALTATLAAQIFTTPILLYNFGSLSLIAPLANVVVVPAVPYAMFAGAAVMVAGLGWQPLADLLAPLAWLPLAWLAEGALALAEVPGAALQTPPLPWQLALSYYLWIVPWWLAHVVRPAANVPVPTGRLQRPPPEVGFGAASPPTYPTQRVWAQPTKDGTTTLPTPTANREHRG